jgi:hypothetical protein
LRYNDLIIVCYDIKSLYLSSKEISISFTNPKAIEEREQEFIECFREIFELNRQCSIEYFSEQDPKEGELEENEYRERITSEYKKYDGVMTITPKTLKIETFLKIIEGIISKRK